MIRKLLIVAGSATALAIVSLGGAWLAAGDTIMGHIRKGESINWHPPGFGKKEEGPRSTRTLTWSDQAPLEIEAPVDLHFVRAATFSMTVSGPEPVLRNLRFEKGRLYLAPDMNDSDDHDGIEVEMRGPTLSAITLRSAGRIRLEGLDQPKLAVDADGAADLEATGKVAALAITARGVGNLDFEDLNASDAKLDLDGVGNVDLNATGAVDIDVSGIGNVTLHARPRTLTTRSDGIGSINKDY